MTIDDLTTQTDLLLENFRSFLTEMQAIAARQTALDQQERDLRVLEQSIEHRRTLSSREQEEVNAQKEYVSATNIDLKKRELRIESGMRELARIRVEQFTLTERQEDLHRQEASLLEKKKEVTALLAQTAEMTKKEALLQKQVAIDRERKRLLDLREEKIHLRERQLQMDASVSDLG